jgi:hypothetical protein
MRKIWPYVGLLIWFVMFLFFILIDLIMYYVDFAGPHSRVPFYISSALTLIVGYFFVMACFETFKHRNDKEEW